MGKTDVRYMQDIKSEETLIDETAIRNEVMERRVCSGG